MDYKQMTSPCGLDCFNCPMYLAKDNPEIRKKIASSMNMPEEQVQCDGCKNLKGMMSFLGATKPCPVYTCAKEKNLDVCCDCNDFPCDFFQPYADKASMLPHNTKVYNLALIKKMGLDNWAKNKAKEVKENYFHGTMNLLDLMREK